MMIYFSRYAAFISDADLLLQATFAPSFPGARPAKQNTSRFQPAAFSPEAIIT
jgi:hypothetical protein